MSDWWSSWKQSQHGGFGGLSPRHQASRPGLLQQARAEVVAVLFSSRMNALLLLLPLAIASDAAGWPAGVTFVLSLLPLCALAERLGMITEQLAMYTNDTLGGLLNATFGNATEVIIAAFAIKKGFLRVVKLTLLGSIISNLLLVMGCAFLAGGLVHPQQRFSQQGINVNCGLLILSVVAVMLPTLLSSTAEDVRDFRAELALSRFESVLMLLCYGLFLVFQLVTHRHLYEDGDKPSAAAAATGPLPPDLAAPGGTSCFADEEQPPTPAAAAGAAAFGQMAPLPNGSSSAGGGRQQRKQGGPGIEVELAAAANGVVHGGVSSSRGGGDRSSRGGGSGGGGGRRSEHVQVLAGDVSQEGESVRLVTGEPSMQVVEEEEEELVLSWLGCFVWLSLVTVFISLLSDYIMDAITDASRQLKVPLPFLTCIVVPIVGNAAEHASALMFAVKDRMEISLGVAVGSSTQVGVLVVPFCVVLAWAVGQPLDLNLNEFEALVLFISVLLAAVVLQDGTSNWLKGAMLVITYVFVAAGFWVHKDPALTGLGDRHR